MPQVSGLQSLNKLGFTENEALVYGVLLKIGSTSAGAIIKDTGLHRNVVYTALDHLVARKLVAEKQLSGVKHYVATSPDILAEEFATKAELAKQVVENIKKETPPGVEEVTVHQGNEEYFQLLNSLVKQLPSGSTKYVLGTGGESFMANTMRAIWRKYHKVAHGQGIKIKMIGYELQRESFLDEVRKQGIYQVKFLPSNLENPSGIHIYPEANTILNIIYSDEHNPVTAIKIKHPSLVQGYLNMFKNLWELAKE